PSSGRRPTGSPQSASQSPTGELGLFLVFHHRNTSPASIHDQPRPHRHPEPPRRAPRARAPLRQPRRGLAAPGAEAVAITRDRIEPAPPPLAHRLGVRVRDPPGRDPLAHPADPRMGVPPGDHPVEIAVGVAAPVAGHVMVRPHLSDPPRPWPRDAAPAARPTPRPPPPTRHPA